MNPNVGGYQINPSNEFPYQPQVDFSGKNIVPILNLNANNSDKVNNQNQLSNKMNDEYSMIISISNCIQKQNFSISEFHIIFHYDLLDIKKVVLDGKITKQEYVLIITKGLCCIENLLSQNNYVIGEMQNIQFFNLVTGSVN